MHDMTIANAKQEAFDDILAPNEREMVSGVLMALANTIHHLNARWWQDIETGEPIARNDGEMIALMHSELSEALEGVRKGLQDDHLPHRPSVEVEMADTVIRIFDYCAGRKLDLGGAIMEKLQYNWHRQDHTIEARREAGGKKF